MAKRMIVLIKGPNHNRGWLIAAEDDDPMGAVAHFLEEDPLRGTETLREALGLTPDDKLPTQIELKVSDLYWRRLKGQVSWR